MPQTKIHAAITFVIKNQIKSEEYQDAAVLFLFCLTWTMQGHGLYRQVSPDKSIAIHLHLVLLPANSSIQTAKLKTHISDNEKQSKKLQVKLKFLQIENKYWKRGVMALGAAHTPKLKQCACGSKPVFGNHPRLADLLRR